MDPSHLDPKEDLPDNNDERLNWLPTTYEHDDVGLVRPGRHEEQGRRVVKGDKGDSRETALDWLAPDSLDLVRPGSSQLEQLAQRTWTLGTLGPPRVAPVREGRSKNILQSESHSKF